MDEVNKVGLAKQAYQGAPKEKRASTEAVCEIVAVNGGKYPQQNHWSFKVAQTEAFAKRVERNRKASKIARAKRQAAKVAAAQAVMAEMAAESRRWESRKAAKAKAAKS